MDGQQTAATGGATGSAATDSSLVTAWVLLPERWRAVLWHHDVESRTPDEVAELLGTSSRAVAALRERALTGLRRGVLGEHQRRADPGCSATLGQLPALLDGTGALAAGTARATVLQRHLDGCGRCSAAADDLRALRGDLAATVLRAARGDAQAG